MTLQTLRVALEDRSYDILTGPGLLDRAGTLAATVAKGRKAFILTDETVAALYLERTVASFVQAGFAVTTLTVPAGEQSKSFGTLEKVLDALLADRCERSTLLVALGGGIIGDLGGFAAAVTLRGIDFIQIPTTVLSQVDSSVGGKTGINTRYGKNLVGSFHQPRLVIADTETLQTLPKREILAGYAEIAKYGLIDDAPFWSWLETHGTDVVALTAEPLAHAIHTSCAAKARVVAADETETGVRALLNLGHTFGHALEAEGGYGGPLLHGEAVAVGMVMAFDLSVAMGLCPAEDAIRVRQHLSAVGLPVLPPKINGVPMNARALLGHMAGDKKVKDGKVTFVLARGIGQSFLSPDVDPAAVLRVLEAAVTA